MPSLKIAVNLSARQFQQPNLVELVAKVFEETGLPPSPYAEHHCASARDPGKGYPLKNLTFVPKSDACPDFALGF